MESPVMVLQEVATIPICVRMSELKKDMVLNQEEEHYSLSLVRPHQRLVTFLKRVAWAKLSNLKPRFVRFLDVLRQIYVKAPFLEALSEAPTYL